MVKRERKGSHSTGASTTKGQIHRADRMAQTKQSLSANRKSAEQIRANYASVRSNNSRTQLEQEDTGEPTLAAEREAQSELPVTREPEQTALAPIDLNPLYSTLAEMQARIQEAEQSLEDSRQAQKMLREEMENALNMAREADEELSAAAKKAARLKHEAEHVHSEGEVLRHQLNTEEKRWQQKLQEEKQLLHEIEQKLKIAEEEAQRINYAKEVAARMNERELWRVGSSKQGQWLQRRKTQSGVLPMTRDKNGSWQMSKAGGSPDGTYSQNVLEWEQRYVQNRPEDDDAQQLSMLSKSAQALANHQYNQMEEALLAQLAEQEAQLHYNRQADLLAAEQAAAASREEARQNVNAPPEPAGPPAYAEAWPQGILQALSKQEAAMPEPQTQPAQPAPAETAPLPATPNIAALPTPPLKANPDDPLHSLALHAAQETSSHTVAPPAEADNFSLSDSQAQLAAAAERLQAQEAATPPPAINESDIQQLARQADLLARQHLARQQGSISGSHGSIAQKVAEETGNQDHLLKEQQIAERAIAAAMAAAKKAAQSAMAISEQGSQQMPQQSSWSGGESNYYPAERIIADALAKAAVANQK